MVLPALSSKPPSVSIRCASYLFPPFATSSIWNLLPLSPVKLYRPDLSFPALRGVTVSNVLFGSTATIVSPVSVATRPWALDKLSWRVLNQKFKAVESSGIRTSLEKK